MLRGVMAVSGSFAAPPRQSSLRAQAFSNKILTSARNGELIMWDLNKNGLSKYGKTPMSYRYHEYTPKYLHVQSGERGTTLGQSMCCTTPLFCSHTA